MAFARFMQREQPFSRLASEYVASNCYIGVSPFDVRQIPMDQLVGKDADQNPLPGFHIGADNAMFGADYPHFESIVPNTMDKVSGLVDDPSVDRRRTCARSCSTTRRRSTTSTSRCSRPHRSGRIRTRRRARHQLHVTHDLEEFMTVHALCSAVRNQAKGLRCMSRRASTGVALDDFDYVEEEWFATGEADGRHVQHVGVRAPTARPEALQRHR